MRRMWKFLGLALLLACLLPEASEATTYRNGCSAVNTTGTTVTTLTCNVASVATGDVVFVWCKYEGASATVTATDTASTYVAGTAVYNTSVNNLGGRLNWTLASATSGTVTYTCNYSPARAYVTMVAMVFVPTSSTTPTTDVQNTNFGNATSATSGTVTTTGTDEIVVGTYGEYSATNTSSETINGVAADGVIRSANYSSMWYRILTGTFTGGQASGSLGGAQEFISTIGSVKMVAGGGGSAQKFLWGD